MKRRLVIDGNEIYEIDEMCEWEKMRREQTKEKGRKVQKEGKKKERESRGRVE